jgi:two-component system phosphate regulon sensor histidine kinase PhoR
VSTQGIFRDITERKQAEEAKSEIDRLKSEFISNISHELRSPLHSIRGFSNLILDGKVPDPETQKEFLTIIDRQSEHLGSLVDNLLDMSRIEAGQFSIRKQLTSIENVIHSAVETFYTVADEKDIIITEDIQPILPEIEVDEERLKQVMMNLLSNAIKFTKDSSPVTVKVKARDGELLVQVIDRGIGIPKEVMPRLFERFQQAEAASRIGGAGLGLYISKQIIEAHGGRIWAKSKEGKGSTFYFTLPLGQEGGNSHE